RGIFSGESPSPMARHAAIRVGNDLPPRQSRVTLRAADDEPPRWIDVYARLAVSQPVGNDVFDHLLGHLRANHFQRNVRIVLRRDHYRIHSNRPVALVLNGYLGFTVRPQVRDVPVLADRSKVTGEIV